MVLKLASNMVGGSQTSLKTGEDNLWCEGRDPIWKVVIRGADYVGKSSLLVRYVSDTFADSIPSTVGVDCGNAVLKLEDDRAVKLQVWDTASQDIYSKFTKSYYKSANAIVLVYSITSHDSFCNLSRYLSDILDHKSVLQKLPKLVLVGNKSDLEKKREVTARGGQTLADLIGATFFEASARSCMNVDEIFAELAMQLDVQTEPEADWATLQQSIIAGCKYLKEGDHWVRPERETEAAVASSSSRRQRVSKASSSRRSAAALPTNQSQLRVSPSSSTITRAAHVSGKLSSRRRHVSTASSSRMPVVTPSPNRSQSRVPPSSSTSSQVEHMGGESSSRHTATRTASTRSQTRTVSFASDISQPCSPNQMNQPAQLTSALGGNEATSNYTLDETRSLAAKALARSNRAAEVARANSHLLARMQPETEFISRLRNPKPFGMAAEKQDLNLFYCYLSAYIHNLFVGAASVASSIARPEVTFDGAFKSFMTKLVRNIPIFGNVLSKSASATSSVAKSAVKLAAKAATISDTVNNNLSEDSKRYIYQRYFSTENDCLKVLTEYRHSNITQDELVMNIAIAIVGVYEEPLLSANLTEDAVKVLAAHMVMRMLFSVRSDGHLQIDAVDNFVWDVIAYPYSFFKRCSRLLSKTLATKGHAPAISVRDFDCTGLRYHSSAGYYYQMTLAKKKKSTADKLGYRRVSEAIAAGIKLLGKDMLPFPFGESTRVTQSSSSSIPFASAQSNSANEVLMYGLRLSDIAKDGHCFYRAICHLHYRQQQSVGRLRSDVCDYLQLHPELAVGMTDEDYQQRIEINRNASLHANEDASVEAWADNLEIVATMQIIQRPIVIVDYTENHAYPLITVIDRGSNPYQSEPVFLRYDGSHYDAYEVLPGFDAREILQVLHDRYPPVTPISLVNSTASSVNQSEDAQIMNPMLLEVQRKLEEQSREFENTRREMARELAQLRRKIAVLEQSESTGDPAADELGLRRDQTRADGSQVMSTTEFAGDGTERAQQVQIMSGAAYELATATAVTMAEQQEVSDQTIARLDRLEDAVYRQRN